MSLRPGRTPLVAVTGAAYGLGKALADRLDAAGESLARRTTGTGEGLADQLAGASVVVHLATSYDVTMPAQERRRLNVGGTAALLAAARDAGVSRVVLTTSAEVWGPAALPGDGWLPDAVPRAGAPDEDALVGDHIEVEALAEQAGRDGLCVTVLRPATLVAGPLGRAYDGQALRQLGAPRLLALRGVEPLWQLCHVDDLLSALELAAAGAVQGVRAVACEGALPQRRVEALSGRRRLELPSTVALATAERLHRLGVTTSSPRELDYLVAPRVLACDGLRAAGWVPAWSNETALQAHLSARSDEGRTAAATAAGATVAVLGTAALIRRTRRHRHR